MDPILEYGSISLLVCLVTVSTVANMLALLAYCRRPGFKNVSDRFVVNVLAGNMPMSASAAWATWETLSGEASARTLAAESATCGLAAATLYGVFLVAADQHRAVTDPLRYRAAPHRRRPAAAAAVAWAVAVLCAVGRVAVSSTSSPVAMPIFRWLYLCVAIAPPAAAVVYMNIRIYATARCSRATPPGGGVGYIGAVARGRTSAGRASAAAAVLGVMHAPHAIVTALTFNPYCRAAAFALLCLAACLAPFPLALRSRRVRRELQRVLRPSLCTAGSLRAPPRRNPSACALHLLAASDVEKGEGASSTSSIAAELTANLSLPIGPDDTRASFSSGASTQLSAASDD